MTCKKYREPIEGERVFATCVPDRGFIPRILKERLKRTIKTPTTQLKNTWPHTLQNKISKWPISMWKRDHRLSSRKCKLKPQCNTIISTPPKWLKSKQLRVSSVHKDTEQLVGAYTVRPLWETAWQFLLNTCPGPWQFWVHTYTRRLDFIFYTQWFLKWKQVTCPSTGQWVNTILHSHGEMPHRKKLLTHADETQHQTIHTTSFYLREVQEQRKWSYSYIRKSFFWVGNVKRAQGRLEVTGALQIWTQVVSLGLVQRYNRTGCAQKTCVPACRGSLFHQTDGRKSKYEIQNGEEEPMMLDWSEGTYRDLLELPAHKASKRGLSFRQQPARLAPLAGPHVPLSVQGTQGSSQEQLGPFLFEFPFPLVPKLERGKFKAKTFCCTRR